MVLSRGQADGTSDWVVIFMLHFAIASACKHLELETHIYEHFSWQETSLDKVV